MYSNEIDSRHVVPIGGAQFVPPIMTHFGHVPHFTTSPTSEASSSASGSYSPRESLSSPIHSRFSSSSSSSGSATSDLEEWDSVQAHLSYAKQMASHTAAMWQKERLAIEKAKLEARRRPATRSIPNSTKPLNFFYPTLLASSYS
ncbi:hypothetical protein BCV70DRAFT_4683 [Testicularia cyperi]|uniref:Uncharacterized protein n=1 Tax=Testicularia cyperi TaxID=1882483 RepID=A0A317XWK2_9BASI|nr:hypothetical protein BCV70DRAFT_4683 [Testicularia cyperi]